MTTRPVQRHDEPSRGMNSSYSWRNFRGAGQYDADLILADPEMRGIAAVIQTKRNRTVQPVVDGHISSLRTVVERCFSKAKHSRKLPPASIRPPQPSWAYSSSFLGLFLVVSFRLWIQHFVQTAWISVTSSVGISKHRKHPPVCRVREVHRAL